MDLGPHAVFIWTAYAATALVIAALMAWLYADGIRQQSALDDFEARGIKRRSEK